MRKYIDIENYFLLVIFLLPAYLLRFSIFSLPTNLWEVLALTAIALAIWKIGKSINLSQYEKKIIFLFLIIILGLIAGMIKSGNYWTGLGIIKGWFLIPFAFAFLATKIIKDKKRAYLSLFLSAFFVAVIALVYKFLGVVTFDGRLEAFFNSPNYLAMYLSPGIITGAILYSKNQKSKIKNQNNNSKLKIISITPIILASLFFTYSYAALISVALALVIVFLLNHKLSKKYLIIISAIFLVLIFLLKDTAKFNDLVNFDSRSSLSSRMMIWNSAGKILSDNYLLGIGPGNFQDKYLEYQKFFPPYLEWAVPHPHNLYLTFWLYSGIFGLFAFVGILYLFFTKVETRHCLVSTEVRCIALAIIIYFLLHGLVDTTYFKNDLAVVFWLAIFLA